MYNKFPDSVAGQTHSLRFGQPLATQLRSFNRHSWPKTPLVTPQPLKLCSALTVIIVIVRLILRLFAPFSYFLMYRKFPHVVADQHHSLRFGQTLETMLFSFDRQRWPRTPLVTPGPLKLCSSLTIIILIVQLILPLFAALG